MADVEPDWSREHISRGNKFTLQLALAWLALVVLSAMFAQTGVLGFAFVGLAALFLTWVLVHVLFEHVDQLVKTRLVEADALGDADDRADGDADDGMDDRTDGDTDDRTNDDSADSDEDETDDDAAGPD